MPTDNKTVTCYLPPEIEESLTEYCTKYGITRKHKDGTVKASLGTGVVEVLKRFFFSDTVPSPLPNNVYELGLSEERVKEIVIDVVKDSSDSLLSDTLPSNVLTEDRFHALMTRNITPVKDSVKDLQSSVAKLDGYLDNLTRAVQDNTQAIASHSDEIAAIKNYLTSLTPSDDTQDLKANPPQPLETIDEAAPEQEEKANLPSVPEGAITTTELARKLRISDSLMRNWASKRESGKPFSPRSHRQSWREFTTHWEKIETEEGVAAAHAKRDRWIPTESTTAIRS